MDEFHQPRYIYCFDQCSGPDGATAMRSVWCVCVSPVFVRLLSNEITVQPLIEHRCQSDRLATLTRTCLSRCMAGHAALARCWRRHNGNLLIRPSVNTRTTLLAYTRVARTFTLIVTHDLDTEISHGRARPVDDQLGITRILYAKKG